MPSSGFKKCALDRKSTRLNSSHTIISYAVFCLKKIHAPASFPETHADSRPRGSCTMRGRWFPVLVCGDATAGDDSYFFFNDTATTEISTLSLHDALPISGIGALTREPRDGCPAAALALAGFLRLDRKSTRLNSSHTIISYAAFFFKKLTWHLVSSLDNLRSTFHLPWTNASLHALSITSYLTCF